MLTATLKSAISFAALFILCLPHFHCECGTLANGIFLDCVFIACSLESIMPGLVQGCKAPNGVG